MSQRTLKLVCSEHGETEFKSFCYGGIELSCGCLFLLIYGRGLVFHETPPWQNKQPIKIDA